MIKKINNFFNVKRNKESNRIGKRIWKEKFIGNHPLERYAIALEHRTREWDEATDVE